MNTNPNAKTIVCYGDSNTWGDVPNKDKRYPADVRWPGVLQILLGDEWDVVSEGLNGRTFVAEDPDQPHRRGITHLKSILKTNDPIDVVVIMLGTNDLKSNYNLSPDDIAEHLKETVELILNEDVWSNESNKEVLIICPAPVAIPNDVDLDERMENAPKLSLELPALYKKVADELDCSYLNAGDHFNLENTDGYHLNDEHHKILGEKVADIIKNL